MKKTIISLSLLILALIPLGCSNPVLKIETGPGYISNSAGDLQITPSKTWISGISKNSSIEVEIQISNLADTDRTFIVTSRDPDILDQGYTPASNSWFIINGGETVTVPSNSKVLVTIEISIPVRVTKSQYETWISIIESNQTGTVWEEVCSKLYLDF